MIVAVYIFLFLILFVFIFGLLSITINRIFNNLAERKNYINGIIIIFSLSLSILAIKGIRYYFGGLKTEKHLDQQYFSLVNKSLPRLNRIRSSSSVNVLKRNAKGIVVLKYDSGELILDAVKMRQMPVEYRPDPETLPKLIITINDHKKHVSTAYGAMGGKRYEYCYSFNLYDFVNGSLIKEIWSPWEYQDLSFPDKKYNEIFKQACHLCKTQPR